MAGLPQGPGPGALPLSTWLCSQCHLWPATHTDADARLSHGPADPSLRGKAWPFWGRPADVSIFTLARRAEQGWVARAAFHHHRLMCLVARRPLGCPGWEPECCINTEQGALQAQGGTHVPATSCQHRGSPAAQWALRPRGTLCLLSIVLYPQTEGVLL